MINNTLIQLINDLLIDAWAAGHNKQPYGFREALDRVRQHAAQPPQEVVERVAEAISPWYNLRKSSTPPDEFWQGCSPAAKGAYREQAKAAIAAMGECPSGQRIGSTEGEGHARAGSNPASSTTSTLNGLIHRLQDLIEELDYDCSNWNDIKLRDEGNAIVTALCALSKPCEIPVVDEDRLDALIRYEICNATLGIDVLVEDIIKAISPYLKQPAQAGEIADILRKARDAGAFTIHPVHTDEQGGYLARLHAIATAPEQAGETWCPNAERFYSAADYKEALESRDDFIVSKGLWPEYVEQLPPSTSSPIPSPTKREAQPAGFEAAIAALGSPDDEFNKWHLDEGELRSFAAKCQTSPVREIGKEEVRTLPDGRRQCVDCGKSWWGIHDHICDNDNSIEDGAAA